MPQLRFAHFLRATPSRSRVTAICSTGTLVLPSRTSISSAFSILGKPQCDSYTGLRILSHRFIHLTQSMELVTLPEALPTIPNITIPEYLFSPNTTPDTIAEASKLLASATRPWGLIQSPPGFQRRIKFKTFATAMKFWSTVADECKAQKHHPEWGNVYNEVVVRWTTHRPKGISSKDVHMAKFCDRTAAELGEIQEPPASEKKDFSQSIEITQKEVNLGVVKESTWRGNSGRDIGNLSRAASSIPHKSEITYPRMPPEKVDTGQDFLSSLLGAEEQICTPCHTGKEKSKAAGTESGPGDTNIKPKDTYPHLENTEGQSILEEIRKHRDELDLADPGLGGYQEDLQVAVKKEKRGKE
ncbi:pterin 4 alpha carbinolamine dehydratase-domain-containing protein [Tirmania nivea]|nr:pterin 4 alpha carbinolamine dehydratase-domain-containing protein [Tirmania nivea]